jgi:hypothetical protein
MLSRAGLDPHTPAGMAAWLALSAVVLVLAIAAMRRAVARSQDAWALTLNAFAGLLISPISWSHHWVWAETGVLVLVITGLRHRDRGGLAAAAIGIAIFAAAPQWWFPHTGNRELHWAVWQQVIGGSYVIYAVAILLLAASGVSASGSLAHRRPARSGLRASDPTADQAGAGRRKSGLGTPRFILARRKMRVNPELSPRPYTSRGYKEGCFP